MPFGVGVQASQPNTVEVSVRVSVSARFMGLCLSLAPAALPQQPAPAVQAQALLQNALSTLVTSGTVTDVTLSGSARRVAGSDDEIGTATLRALSTGESRVDLSFPSGPHSEATGSSSGNPTGSWIGTDGVAHAISQHNLWSDSSWFFPAFTINKLLGGDYAVSYVAHETRNGQAVEHLTAVRQFQAVGAPADWVPDALQRLSAMDVYLDSSTLLPAAISFNTHPDKNALVDIPIEIRLSDYRLANKALVPFHIQKFLQNSLALDIKVASANLNSGLTAAFSAALVQEGGVK
jgi:hypothetical protein